MKTETLPAEGRAAAEELCGEGPKLKLISDRRGSAVWQVTGPRRSAALKVGAGPEGTVITARETAVLTAVDCRGALLAHGRMEGEAWMLTPWYEGPSTWEALRSVRDGEGNRRQALQTAVEWCEAVARLHAIDWVHCDLQPHHAIHTPDGVQLIDCSWAWHPHKLPPSHLFRGGPPHLLAPEMALTIHGGQRPVAPTRAAEVYTLAAGLWWAITGAWPLDYNAIGINPARLTPAVLRQIIGTRPIPLRGPRVWPEVQEILSGVLTAPAPSRPTAAELAALLGDATREV
ncbi:hypothetical protein ACFV7R_46670 [Streptomyces sp. NPDC059866]|uniref:hypothetical protein n=1 Tax=Streptomyces sp. NPDC059866 TaxID=3346978 RepID=UPI0036474449